jgi:membrane fusion protein, heavy metal efflux system
MNRVTVSLLLALAACSDKKPAPGEHEHGHDEHGSGEEQGDEHAAEAIPSMVRIAPEMLRDLRVTTARAEARAAGERVSVLGELQVDQDAYAEVASPVAARIAKVLVRAGDEVAAGQPLATLHSAELGAARAGLGAARARRDVARKTLERKRALAAERLVAEREVLDAEAALAEAEAAESLASATAQPLGAGAGATMTLRAPVRGTVIERDAVLGQLAEPSRTLFRIGDLSKLWLVAHVFERDAVRVRVGGTGTATFAALPGRAIDGAITWIGREVDAASRTIPVRLVVANADGTLRPGMSATVSLPLGDAGSSVVAVPLAAVQRVGDRWVVFAPREPGSFQPIAIGRGRDLGGEVEVLSGLAPGDTIVIDGAFLLKAEADKARGEGAAHEH